MREAAPLDSLQRTLDMRVRNALSLGSLLGNGVAEEL
jgi:hypothetical protein